MSEKTMILFNLKKKMTCITSFCQKSNIVLGAWLCRKGEKSNIALKLEDAKPKKRALEVTKSAMVLGLKGPGLTHGQ